MNSDLFHNLSLFRQYYSIGYCGRKLSSIHSQINKAEDLISLKALDSKIFSEDKPALELYSKIKSELSACQLINNENNTTTYVFHWIENAIIQDRAQFESNLRFQRSSNLNVRKFLILGLIFSIISLGLATIFVGSSFGLATVFCVLALLASILSADTFSAVLVSITFLFIGVIISCSHHSKQTTNSPESAGIAVTA